LGHVQGALAQGYEGDALGQHQRDQQIVVTSELAPASSVRRRPMGYGDFNGDEKKDMIIGTESGSYWYYSTGTGTWNNAYTRTELPWHDTGFTPGDFNGDGKSDVIISNISGSY
jgi:hypothetical protein